MTDKATTPEEVAQEVKEQAEQEWLSAEPVEAEVVSPPPKKKLPVGKIPVAKIPSTGSAGGMVGSMSKSMKDMGDTFKDPVKRKHFFTHEDMEPHRHLFILLGLTFIITVIVAFVF
ncbi:MAG: hypothetical protein QCI38_00600 [Candidatus Thermoplasmatota archaeon]|nr:hypothetical protein [Candidatus Thermoplasmatota archaeon]